MILKKLGERIRQLRHEAKISQEKLAELSGLDRTYINGVENGRRNISIINIEKIASAFGITLKNFFNFKEIDDGKQG
jgi:transcriptional regulator with XRE-family HTH domain